MPIYEYQCEACGHRLEKLQKVNADPMVVCPSCEKQSLVKLVSASAFRLKGSGWYETDFKSGSKKNLVEGDKSSTASSSSTGGGSGDSSSGSGSAGSGSDSNTSNAKDGAGKTTEKKSSNSNKDTNKKPA